MAGPSITNYPGPRRERTKRRNLKPGGSDCISRSNNMNKSAKSLFVFGIYSLMLGITLMVIPNLLFALVGIPATHEVWVRVAGMLLFALGIYYTLAARKGLTEFIKWTVYTRASVVFFFAVFVLLGLSKPVLILLGCVDLLFAIWTGLALRSEKKS